MKIENLYIEEQRLLNELVESEGKSEKEYQNAVKRTITRLNEELETIESKSE